jgi:hypothetical protein
MAAGTSRHCLTRISSSIQGYRNCLPRVRCMGSRSVSRRGGILRFREEIARRIHRRNNDRERNGRKIGDGE